MMSRKARQRGFTLFELGVAVAVIAILVVVLLSRLSFYRDEAERLAFEQTVTALRTEVRLKAFGLMIAGREQEGAALVGQNPINWLAQKPANYLGEYYSPDTNNLATGHWFFDRDDGFLVYLLNRGNTFSKEGSELLQFKVSLSQEPGNSTVDAVGTLDMRPVQVRKNIAKIGIK
ncbi:prepilin-type N-terminal cleavage/methylation domain-containing protein [Janthinobacterium sp. HLS12-2]|uniref:prepilin-type N-terminal cleavage/methylation domain-containing protein n=1 Tax=Janthinobacterium sp. HLS12-2 TaxID=1259324 RepID=UPI003F29504E